MRTSTESLRSQLTEPTPDFSRLPAELQLSLELFYGHIESLRPSEFTPDTVRFLRANKAPGALLPRFLSEGDTHLAQFVAEECGKHDEASLEFARVLEAWREGSIPAVLIKSPGYFPYTSDNVDVLVAPDKSEEAIGLLESLGYGELPWVAEPFKRLFRLYAGHPLGFAIHLHTRVGWINGFFDAQPIIDEGVVTETGWRVPSPTHAFLITTAHWFYEDKGLTLRDLVHTSLLLGESLDSGAMVKLSKEQGWFPGLVSAMDVLRSASTQLGLHRLTDSLPQVEGSVPRWIRNNPSNPRLPWRISKTRTKMMHFRKTIDDPRLTAVDKLVELLRLFWYALRVQLKPILPQPHKRVLVDVDPQAEGNVTRACEMLSRCDIRIHVIRPGDGRRRTEAALRRLGGLAVILNPRSASLNAGFVPSDLVVHPSDLPVDIAGGILRSYLR